MRTLIYSGVFVCAVLAHGWCAPAADTTEKQAAPVAISAEHLANVFRIHDKVLSGGEPVGEEAFAELASLGVKTIISVDGAKPDVAAAKKFGLRYVHLPHGYDGISTERGKDIAKAVRDLPGTVYIHCHHGKHRSPAAATVACVSLGWVPPENAKLILQTAGTSEHYLGLYAAAESARPLARDVLDAARDDFPAVAELPPLAEAMVTIDHALERLTKSGTQSNAAHQALLLKEQLVELERTDIVRSQNSEFQKLLAANITTAETLETGLREERTWANMDAALSELKQNCTACHAIYRDRPRER